MIRWEHYNEPYARAYDENNKEVGQVWEHSVNPYPYKAAYKRKEAPMTFIRFYLAKKWVEDQHNVAGVCTICGRKTKCCS